MSPALAGEFPKTVPPGKPLQVCISDSKVEYNLLEFRWCILKKIVTKNIDFEVK